MAPPTKQDGQKQVLVVSLSLSLSGHPIQNVIDQNRERWPQESLPFDIAGFDVDKENPAHSLEELGAKLDEGSFDGVVVGWCSRGYKDRTILFEQIVNVCASHAGDAKLIFNTGPDDIIQPLVRNFV